MNLTTQETARMNYAARLATAQIEAAKKLHAIHFGADSSPETLAAIIEAVARNYASAVAANLSA